MKNQYKILGVEPDATPEQIKKAYRKRAKQTHPDKGGDPKEFSELNTAVTSLLDPLKRARIDAGEDVNDAPDNKYANAMEQIAGFFINSINSAVESNTAVHDLDFVAGARKFFGQQINNQNVNILKFENQIRVIENVKKRLKTKRKDDLIVRMLDTNIANARKLIAQNKAIIETYELALQILDDYEMIQDPDAPPAYSPSTNAYQRVFTHQVPPGFFR